MMRPPKHRKPPTPEWEDEDKDPEQPREQSVQTARERDEADTKLFLEAASQGPIISKDKDTTVDGSTRSGKPRAQKVSNRHEIDLHGMTVDEARRYVIAMINSLLAQAKGQTLDIRVITGKGNNSRGQPQLISSIHHVVEEQFRHRLVSIEVSPHELQISGRYLKGHFDIKIR
jgi:DNA-nicking Smr family endonuclease